MIKILLPDEIKDFLEKIHYNGCYVRLLKTYHKDTYIHLMLFKGKSFSEKIYNYINVDISNECKNCKKITRFVNITSGYKLFCSEKCDKDFKDKNSKLNKKLESQSLYNPKCEHPNCCNYVIKNKNNLWSKHCSNKCKGSHNSLKSRTQARTTLKNNWGVEHALQSPVLLKKSRETLKENWNVENPMYSQEIKDKMIELSREKFGTDNPFQNIKVRQRHTATLKLKYGSHIDNISQIPTAQLKKEKSQYTHKDYMLPSGKIIRYQGYEDRFLDKFLKFNIEDNLEFDQKPNILYKLNINDTVKKTYFPDIFLKNNTIVEIKSDYTFYDDFEKNISKGLTTYNEGYIFVFYILNQKNYVNIHVIDPNFILIKEFLDKNNIEYNLFDKFENNIVDFYIPSLKIIINYRNLNFHNEIYLDKDYYTLRQKYFDLNNITCYTLEENLFNNTTSIEKFLENKLNLSQAKIYARKTKIQIVNSKEAKIFYDLYHFRNYVYAPIHIALIFDNEIVAMMSFTNKKTFGVGNKKQNKSIYTLVRFASKERTVGGASKLLKYFIQNYNPSSIKSFSDNSVSNGNLYKQLGFSLNGQLKSDYRYSYMNSSQLWHRSGFTKKFLEKKLDYFDNCKTEKELMLINGYLRVYDIGKKKWILDLSTKSQN